LGPQGRIRCRRGEEKSATKLFTQFWKRKGEEKIYIDFQIVNQLWGESCSTRSKRKKDRFSNGKGWKGKKKEKGYVPPESLKRTRALLVGDGPPVTGEKGISNIFCSYGRMKRVYMFALLERKKGSGTFPERKSVSRAEGPCLLPEGVEWRDERRDVKQRTASPRVTDGRMSTTVGFQKPPRGGEGEERRNLNFILLWLCRGGVLPLSAAKRRNL